jgi:formyl-CoA transferase
LLGEHTNEILTDVLGYSAEELAQIIESGAVGAAK